ncbi:hypothetical protein GCM10011418_23330 [Sphingobacterium alkalisoli]|uniref:DUF4268 domain-containing protein n=1 Tax=Sphingobacterium alkalisoli TaxID=1874115 RepID=UPI00166851B4|nr:DUF4268 domain-containing protein [Sphingobacterium alkalisoli]GGH19158.1 hypothetical protein GCM10011418_23330 [Sphingobacterium alkalisoli]
MYSRDETKKAKEQFWTTFGQYMAAVPSSDLERINWVNYKTEVRNIFFRMDATSKEASIMIEMSHPDEGIRQLMFEQFLELKSVFQTILQEDWEWHRVYHDAYGKQISCISVLLEEVSIFKKDDWPALISFFKPRIIALDEFWSTAKYSFDIFK